MGGRVNKKNSQEIEPHGAFKDRWSKYPAGQSGCGPEGEDRLQAENGGTAFRAPQFKNVSSFRPPRPYVRFWLLADIQPHPELLPLCPRKRTYLEAAQQVRL